MKIVQSCPEDAGALTNVAVAAKRHWGYPESWMVRWRDALTVTPDYIRAHPTYAVVLDEKIAGFCALQIQAREAVLDHLWVLPAAMGRGVGRALFAQAETIARERGARRLKITGDPHAAGFYLRMGAIQYGEEYAAMDGKARFLPLLEKVLV